VFDPGPSSDGSLVKYRFVAKLQPEPMSIDDVVIVDDMFRGGTRSPAILPRPVGEFQSVAVDF